MAGNFMTAALERVEACLAAQCPEGAFVNMASMVVATVDAGTVSLQQLGVGADIRHWAVKKDVPALAMRREIVMVLRANIRGILKLPLESDPFGGFNVPVTQVATDVNGLVTRQDPSGAYGAAANWDATIPPKPQVTVADRSGTMYTLPAIPELQVITVEPKRAQKIVKLPPEPKALTEDEQRQKEFLEADEARKMLKANLAMLRDLLPEFRKWKGKPADLIQLLDRVENILGTEPIKARLAGTEVSYERYHEWAVKGVAQLPPHQSPSTLFLSAMKQRVHMFVLHDVMKAHDGDLDDWKEFMLSAEDVLSTAEFMELLRGVDWRYGDFKKYVAVPSYKPLDHTHYPPAEKVYRHKRALRELLTKREVEFRSLNEGNPGRPRV